MIAWKNVIYLLTQHPGKKCSEGNWAKLNLFPLLLRGGKLFPKGTRRFRNNPEEVPNDLGNLGACFSFSFGFCSPWQQQNPLT